MPAVSRSQKTAMRIAEHHPEKLYSRNKGLLGMSKSELHEFSSGESKGLPYRKNLLRKKK